MIRTNELRGIIAKNGLSQGRVALALGVTPKTFYEKMKIGVFRSDEIEKMVQIMDIEDPWDIFFAPSVTLKVSLKTEVNQ